MMSSASNIMPHLSLVCGLIVIATGTVLADYPNNQNGFLRSLENYEIVIPTQVTKDGVHLTNKLHPVHKRSVDYTNSHIQDGVLHYSVHIENKEHILKVQPNRQLVSPGLIIERRRSRFKNVTDSSFKWLHDDHKHCHFHGHVVNQTDSRVAIGVCNGLHGFIHTESGNFLIEPLQDAVHGDNGEHRHAVYRRSAMPNHLDPLSGINLHKYKYSSIDDIGPGNQDALREEWQQKNHPRTRSTHSRRKRSVSTERYVETMIVVDPSMIKYHKNEHLETYVLTILNMVATMFHDASIGNSINIVLVRILLLEEQQEELVITHHADKTLKSFCKFQKNINFKDDDHPNHHDVAILLTRKNICSRLDEPCGTLGLAQVSGMCQPHRSCSINEDTGLALAYTVTHELGHNFGMHHDSSNNGCPDPPGRQLYIMAPSLIADSLFKVWSNCSKRAITKFIDRDWGYCLDDEPVDHQYKFPVLPPGTMYDADHQCRLQYGSDDATICSNIQDVCSNLWCQSGNKCSTHLEAAAEGTICGTNMWCYEGKCVKIADRAEAINGEWGEWSAWSECSRSCSAGVSHSQRFCDNPQPSHGGKYCLGERKRYRICNTEDCEEDGISFNQQQCSDFDFIPYKKKLYEWEHVPTSETPCQLHCKPKDKFFSVLLKDIVTDGTRCMPGTRNMCISGRCRHVGCDYVIDSKAKDDRCGVCHGDGSTCKTIKSQYNESQGLGYVEAAVIPTGARNIRVEEVAAANNFLALQNNQGEYFLNGHWFIQWSGDYKVAGTVVQYERNGNKESFNAVGPLKEPLHVMLLLQSENPGVKFEYTVPKDNITEMRAPEFNWHYEPWTHCTASCGGGTQRSEVVCTEIEAGVVDDNYCDQASKPDDKQRVCNEHLCPARWWVGPWQHCSVTCGDNGLHQRTVICIRSLGPDEQIALEDEACQGEIKPAEVEACHKKDPCPGNSTWLTGDWSSCNGNHCGLKYRKVWCQNVAIGCEANKAPPSEMQCSDVTCGQWTVGEWSECTSTCGDGVQIRKLSCVDGEFCDTTLEPLSQRNCSHDPCKTIVQTTEKTTKITSTNSEIEPGESINSVSTRHDLEQETSTYSSTLDKSSSVEDETESDTEIEDNSEEIISDDKSDISSSFEEQSSERSDSVEESISDLDIKSVEDSGPINEGDHSRNTGIINEAVNGDKNNEELSEENDEGEVNQDNTHKIEEQFENTDKETSEYSQDENIGNTKPNSVKQNKDDVHTELYSESGHKHRHHHGKHDKDTKSQIDKILVSKAEHVESEIPTNNQDSDEHFKVLIDSNDKEQHNSQSDTIKPDNLAEDDSLPPLPKLDDLPPLPDMSDLPDIEDLPPIPNGDKVLLSHSANKEPNNQDKHVKSQVITAKFPSIKSKSGFPKLPDLKDLPKLEDLPPLPDLEKFSQTDTLIPLPDDMDLGPLPKLEDLPPLPDITNFNNKDLLPPLQTNDMNPETDNTDVETDKDTSTSSDSIIPKDINIDTNKDLPRNTDDSSDLLNRPVTENIDSDMDTDVNTHSESDINEMPKSKIGNLNTELYDGDILIDENNAVKPSPKDSNTKTESREKYEWKTSNWNECSRKCNFGVRTRTVTCTDSLTETVDKGLCDITMKPTAIEDCNTQECLPWTKSEWSSCSTTCGYSRRQRQVTCPKAGQCDPRAEPSSVEVCRVPDCVMWVSGQWSRCTKKCDGGEQVRLVQCVNLTSQLPSRGCHYDAKPSESQKCNTDPCQDNNEALIIDCEHNEMSSMVCRALHKMGHCQKRFVSLKCCKTCAKDKRRKANKDRPRKHALR